jgi:hypothetical protein
MHCSNEHTGKREPVEVFDEIEQELGMDPGPAMGKEVSIADIGRYYDATREISADLQQPVRVFDSAGSDNDTLSAVIEQALDGFPAPDSTSDLHFCVGGTEDRLNFRSVVATPGDTVEIHDVQVAKPVLSPRYGDPDWIGDAYHFLIVRAGGELNTRAATQVERGNCDHRARSG